MIIQSYKVYEDYIEFNIKQAENIKITERRKTSFPKEKMINPGLYKPVLKKIMTTVNNAQNTIS